MKRLCSNEDEAPDVFPIIMSMVRGAFNKFPDFFFLYRHLKLS